MLFITEKRPDLRIYSPQLGRSIVFEDGRYETDDRAEIAVLKRNRYVDDGTDWVRLSERSVSSASFDGPDPDEVDTEPELPAVPRREATKVEAARWEAALPDEDEDDADRPADH